MSKKLKWLLVFILLLLVLGGVVVLIKWKTKPTFTYDTGCHTTIEKCKDGDE